MWLAPATRRRRFSASGREWFLALRKPRQKNAWHFAGSYPEDAQRMKPLDKL
jgi:hypothetical protein